MLPACSGDAEEGGHHRRRGGPLGMWVFAELHATCYEQVAPAWNARNPDRPVDPSVTVHPHDDVHDELQLAANSGTGTAVIDSSSNKDFAAERLAVAELSPEADAAVREVLGFDPADMSVRADEAVTEDPEDEFNKYSRTDLFDTLNQVEDGIGHFDAFTNPNLPALDSVFTTVTWTQSREGPGHRTPPTSEARTPGRGCGPLTSGDLVWA
ncbi:hypothetical protein [Kineococcus indalonis]|uniref:hypothetical protein n=1 Tax=Kineococcus indalonis TaxID=2696566 RepID=UPI0014128C00|nr:hypothetical protein [Kineococcus indalonis]NAZ85784.1 hypothetical protein [Kineococcus indalonis]